MTKPLHRPYAIACFLLLVGCSTPVEYEDDWLDSPLISDPSLEDPTFRVSTRPGLTAADRSKPVVIAAHGFTASTYEWQEFAEFAEANGDFLVSRVLLGGHGRTIGEFEKSSWRVWGQPIIDEYDALVEQGYTDISLAGASTGGALILQQIASGRFDRLPPRHFFFIDPIVVPGDKSLTLISLVGPLLGNVPQDDITEAERPHWYSNRPSKALDQLYKLCKRVRSDLHNGFQLPQTSSAKVYKTAQDRTADPVGALLIYKGMRSAGGERVGVEMIDSDLHVFTRLQGRDPDSVRESNRQHQQAAFAEMANLLTQRPTS